MKSSLNLIFYITDYGYGHATRSIALIRELLLPKYNISQITVCSGKALPFIKKSLQYDQRINFREQALDLGYIHESGSIDLSSSLLQERYVYYHYSFSSMVSMERAFLALQKPDMVLSDISPIPFLAASQLNVISVGISNFTWYTAYEEALTPELIQLLEQCYRCMDYFVRLPGGETEPDWGVRGGIAADFYCRRVDSTEKKRIRSQLDPFQNKTVIFFALGMSIDLSDISNMKLLKHEKFVFIVSSNMEVFGENIFNIESNYTETQNFVAASDIVVTKPGWSLISEAVVSHKPLVLLERGNILEDRKNINAAWHATNTVTIQWDELREMEDPNFFEGMIISSKNDVIENHKSFYAQNRRSGVKVVAEFIKSLLDFHITT
ncbi:MULTISPECIES: hypothetical protein [Paenibacillus]|uniref:Glycosyl transferase family 28 C-terminal domain-containing protein n=1 Tax=Paenibacillus pabuli TaxID=1472 RepID=A0A855YET2_9BACL|nr:MULTISPECIES: hypothetical protein [Paenibacillus]PWW45227.1 hypothetical protein DET56_101428 [Paenibacillus pabuli]PXW11564.1 hypothetical protein DEU73_101428 [Paenibacillus taichungensis]